MKPKAAIIAGVLIVLSAAAAFAAQEKIAIVYDQGSSVNRHAAQFIAQGASGSGYALEAVNVRNPINVDDYKAVVVLNTGVRSGIDPMIQDFLDGNRGKSNVILLSLYQGSRDIAVHEQPAAQNPEGVDAISSASLWGGGLFGGSKVLAMHEEWLKSLMRTIG